MRTSSKLIISSFIYLLAGTYVWSLSFLSIDLAFFYRWWDFDFIWGILLTSFVTTIFALFLGFLDLLIIRFLFKLEFSRNNYFIIGIITGALFYWIMTLA